MTQSSILETLDNGIHKVTWYSNETEEMERFAQWFMEQIADLPSGSMVRVLHDYSHIGTPSFSRLRHVMSRYDLSDNITLRVAHIYDDSIYPVIMKNVTLVTGIQADRRYFRPSEESDAIEWLLDG